MKKADGTELRGEFAISDSDFHDEKPEFFLDPKPKASPRAIDAIMSADMVVIAPGNLYGSLAPALIVPGIGEALRKTKAYKVYVCSLMTKPGQTDGYQVHDFADEIERLAGGAFLDAVVFNTEKPDDELLHKYAKEGELSVGYDLNVLHGKPYTTAGANLLSSEIWSGSKSDPIASSRTLIRHDSDAAARALMELYHHERK